MLIFSLCCARYAAISVHAIARLHAWKNVVPTADPDYMRRVYGSKVAIVVSDVLELLRDEPGTKIVVATTVKIAIALVVEALSYAGVKSVQIDRPNATAEQEAALTEFKSDDDDAPTVLVLHAGVASAGLTLTCARHMFLLEPFFKRGEELQTMNRCHRIGQDRPVTVTTYFTEGSLEERLLAYRDLETDELSSVLRDSNADDSRGLSAAKARFILGLRD
jgi:SNF2 family DNA or RNA helicase